ncbi:hypothetical protein GCM10009834_19840 [Streptomonospora arabica]
MSDRRRAAYTPLDAHRPQSPSTPAGPALEPPLRPRRAAHRRALCGYTSGGAMLPPSTRADESSPAVSPLRSGGTQPASGS